MMTNEARYLIAVILVLAALGVLLIIRRIRQPGRVSTHPYGMPRLAVLDDARIDKNRRLILVRRDNVEHLLLVGGTSDVVVEQYVVQDGNADQPVQLGAIGGVERELEKVDSQDRLRIDSKSKLSGYSGNADSKPKLGNPLGNEQNKSSVDKIPPAIDELLNSQSKAFDSPKDETKALGKSESSVEIAESMVKGNLTSDFTEKKSDFITDTGKKNSKIETGGTSSEFPSAIPKNSESGGQEEKDDSHSAPTFNSDILQSRTSEIGLNTAIAEEPEEESGKLSNLSVKVDSGETGKDKSAATSWISQTDSENEPVVPTGNTMNDSQENPVTSPTAKPTRSFLSSLNEPEVQEGSQSGTVIEKTQPSDSQSAGMGSDPVSAKSGKLKDLQQNGEQDDARDGEGIEKSKKTDDDVFDSIGEEMTKILQELRKNSNTPPPARN